MYPHLKQLKVVSPNHQYTIKEELCDGFNAVEDEFGNQLTARIIPTDKYSKEQLAVFHKEVLLLK